MKIGELEFDPVTALQKARDGIATRGHMKGFLVEPGDRENGAMCLVGALNYATTGSAEWSRSFMDHMDAAGVLMGEDLKGVDERVQWNNAPERTKEEVLAFLDERIAHFKAEASKEQGDRFVSDMLKIAQTQPA